MAVKHSTQGDFAVRLIILLRCDDTPIHGLEELEAGLIQQMGRDLAQWELSL